METDGGEQLGRRLFVWKVGPQKKKKKGRTKRKKENENKRKKRRRRVVPQGGYFWVSSVQTSSNCKIRNF
jgi:hypothetical protein